LPGRKPSAKRAGHDFRRTTFQKPSDAKDPSTHALPEAKTSRRRWYALCRGREGGSPMRARSPAMKPIACRFGNRVCRSRADRLYADCVFAATATLNLSLHSLVLPNPSFKVVDGVQRSNRLIFSMLTTLRRMLSMSRRSMCTGSQSRP